MVRGIRKPWLDEAKVVSLVVIDGPLKGQVFPVTKPRVLLGRTEGDIVLDDSEISRKHCALEVHGSSAVLADLGSTNGTFVGKDRIRESVVIENRSKFRVGGVELAFVVTDRAS